MGKKKSAMIRFTDKDKHFAEIVLRTLIEKRSDHISFFQNEREAIIKALLLALGDNIAAPFDFLADLISRNDDMNEIVPCNNCQEFDCYGCEYERRKYDV